MHKKITHNSNQSGFSLIEVLISIFVFSFSLLGIASMMTISIRNNHNGYLRSQAIIASNNMAATMRANVSGLWTGSYNGTAPHDASTFCDFNSHCDRTQLAQYDMEQWGISLNQLLPGGIGTIECETPAPPVGVMSAGLWTASPPFSGMCSITVSWNESNETGSQLQNISLLIQP
ncbi:MAG: type IV pilus modification protein PilV [Alcanivoracaceae bacterium]|nr:type IV pilus modification protein PilV [Alcanivoracaceae bacterium]